MAGKIELAEVMERINLPQEARNIVRGEELTREEYEFQKRLFYDDIDRFLAQWKEREDKYTWALKFYIRLAADVYEEYQQEGIDDIIYDQTFYDITIWCQECYRKYGIYGLEELWWLGQSVKRRLFRLGRLQFEPGIVEEGLEGQKEVIPAGEEVLNVHIPAGEPLSYEQCKKSFQLAEEFFGGRYQVYVCDSWLLSWHLKELLPEDSNIIRFQNLFDVTKVYYTYPQAEQRIFGDVLEDKNAYPEDTWLQRKAKEYILSGQDLGIGVGFMRLNSGNDDYDSDDCNIPDLSEAVY